MNWLILSLSIAACAHGRKTQTSKPDTSAVAATSPARSVTRAPKGYVLRMDDATADSNAIIYHKLGDRFDITTGPAHILYAPADSLNGAYIVATTIEQLEAPAHPEAFGLFLGGANLEGSAQRYTAFMVRGTGEYLIRVRDGERTRDVIPWTAHAVIPKQNAEGRATYRLTIRVEPDSLRFLVNSTPVTAVSRDGLPADGIFGMRINHNLHVRADVVRRTGSL